MGQQDSGAFGTREAPGSAPEWNSPACCDVFDVEAEDNRVVYTVCCFSGGGRATRCSSMATAWMAARKFQTIPRAT